MTRKTKTGRPAFPAEVFVSVDEADSSFLLAAESANEFVEMDQIVKLARYQLVSTLSVRGMAVTIGDELPVKPVKA